MYWVAILSIIELGLCAMCIFVLQVSLGRKAGTGNIGGFQPWSWMVGKLKSKGLFVEKTRHDFGIA